MPAPLSRRWSAARRGNKRLRRHLVALAGFAPPARGDPGAQIRRRRDGAGAPLSRWRCARLFLRFSPRDAPQAQPPASRDGDEKSPAIANRGFLRACRGEPAPHAMSRRRRAAARAAPPPGLPHGAPGSRLLRLGGGFPRPAGRRSRQRQFSAALRDPFAETLCLQIPALARPARPPSGDADLCGVHAPDCLVEVYPGLLCAIRAPGCGGRASPLRGCPAQASALPPPRPNPFKLPCP